MEFKFYTFNVDFNKSTASESKSLKSIIDDADVICVQEAKHLNIGKVLGDRWSSHQSLASQAMQGVAVVWRKGKVRRIFNKKGSRRGVRHHGYVLGVSNLGLRLLPRYINYRDLVFNGHVIRVISTHRPPQRFARLWRIFDRVLAAFVKRSPYPVIIGMDSNEAHHESFVHQSGLAWRGIGIDGFYLSKSLLDNVVKGSLHEHPKSMSDHHPVSIKLDL